jgi:hypothetical protein
MTVEGRVEGIGRRALVGGEKRRDVDPEGPTFAVYDVGGSELASDGGERVKEDER